MATSEITFRIKVPHPGSMLVLNIIGVLGLAGGSVAVGGLAGWLWGLLTASATMVLLSIIGATYGSASAAGTAPMAAVSTVAAARSA